MAAKLSKVQPTAGYAEQDGMGILVPLQRNPKHCRIMTTLAQRITEMPMAPYIELMRGMSKRDILLQFDYEG